MGEGDEIENQLIDLCKVNNITINSVKVTHGIKYTLTKGAQKVYLTKFDNGRLQVQGSQKNKELLNFLDGFKRSVQETDNSEIDQSYEKGVHLYEIRDDEIWDSIELAIKNQFETLEAKNVKHTKFSYKITENRETLTVTLYLSGKLMVQGKSSELNDKVSSLVEFFSEPTVAELATRYRPRENYSPEETMEKFDNDLKFEKNAQKMLMDRLGSPLWNFLEPHDQKYLLSTLFLQSLPDVKNGNVPEYSCIVMPTSKAYEGFFLKMLFEMGFISDVEYYSQTPSLSAYRKPSKISKLLTKKFPRVIEYFDTFYSTVVQNRHQYMHSDHGKVNKIQSYEEACGKIDKIYADMKVYFDGIFNTYLNSEEMKSIKSKEVPSLDPDFKKIISELEKMDIMSSNTSKLYLNQSVTKDKLLKIDLDLTFKENQFKIILIKNRKTNYISYQMPKKPPLDIKSKIQDMLESWQGKKKINHLNNDIDSLPSFSLRKLNNTIIKPPMIGSDESGKGDYFGPLVCAAVYVDFQMEEELRELGIKDSKKLTDSKIKVLSKEIKRICKNKYAIIELPPAQYNRLYEEFENEGKNLNWLLGWGHAKAIEEVLLKTDCDKAIADQFGNEKYILDKLQEKGRTIEMIQFPKAERYIAVAAASILARERFINKLDELSTDLGINLPKGANDVIPTAKEIFSKNGYDYLYHVAKIHFRTTSEVINS